jgi:hypothetical protein
MLFFTFAKLRKSSYVDDISFSCTQEFAMLVRAERVRQRNEVAIKLGIISPLSSLLSLSRHLLNLQERVVIGFPNFAWSSNYQKD